MTKQNISRILYIVQIGIDENNIFQGYLQMKHYNLRL